MSIDDPKTPEEKRERDKQINAAIREKQRQDKVRKPTRSDPEVADGAEDFPF